MLLKLHNSQRLYRDLSNITNSTGLSPVDRNYKRYLACTCDLFEAELGCVS